MKLDTLETHMRAREAFRALRIRSDAWTILRLDGRAFTPFTARYFAKPFDERLHGLMIEAAAALLQDFQALYAHTFSDEISLVFAPGWRMFDGRVEKLVSVSAGLASATFTRACSAAAHFDSRIWQSDQRDEVIDYFRWRQSDAARCALHSCCYWTLRRAGTSRDAAVRMLQGKDKDARKRLLAKYGGDFDRLPPWQRRGTGLCWQAYEKPGYDPVRDQAVMARRRRIHRHTELPAGKTYGEFLDALLP